MTIDAQAAIDNEDDEMQWYIIILKVKYTCLSYYTNNALKKLIIPSVLLVLFNYLTQALVTVMILTFAVSVCTVAIKLIVNIKT
jgi:hypothetical protein